MGGFHSILTLKAKSFFSQLNINVSIFVGSTTGLSPVLHLNFDLGFECETEDKFLG